MDAAVDPLDDRWQCPTGSVQPPTRARRMPELPEVETTRRGIAPHLLGRRVLAVTLRRPDLRWPIAQAIRDELPGQTIHGVRRRAKYLLIEAESGSAILHLGMSGCLRVLPAATPASKHDHVDLLIEGGWHEGDSHEGDSSGGDSSKGDSSKGDSSSRDSILRLNDPRRFGALLWQPHGEIHPLLANLGPEPLEDEFDGTLLYRLSRGRTAPVKTFLMDQATVVGVGNIYAAESLFEAGIDPRRAAGRVSLARYQRLADAVKRILNFAIQRGGTTLRDFLNPDGAPGYFEQELLVYGRERQACRACGVALIAKLIGQRATVWCPRCQR